MSPAQKARGNKKLKGGPSPNRLCGSGEPLVGEVQVVCGQRAEVVTGARKVDECPREFCLLQFRPRPAWMVSERRSQSLEAENL